MQITATSGIVPIVDFQPFLTGTPEEKKATANELVHALKNVGFIMLRDFYSEEGVGEAQVEGAFEQSRKFFALSMEEKTKLDWTTAEASRGYVSQGRERVTQATSKEDIAQLRAQAPDLKESMEIGKDYIEGPEDSPHPNRWPESLPEFKAFMNPFFYSCHILQVQVMQAIAVGLGLDQHYFDQKVAQQSHNLRLLNYPPVSQAEASKSDSRAGAHSDYGTVTLLFQDDVGGLEVQDKEGKFVPAKPVPGTVVINVGDLLQQWTNDVLKSTIHRVVLPETKGAAFTPQRNSIAFFGNPSLREVITCIPGLGEPKYEPVLCEEYLVRRLGETFGV